MYVFIYLLVTTILSIYSSISLTGRDIYYIHGCRRPRRGMIGSHRMLSRWGDQRPLVAENLGLAVRIHIFIDFLEVQFLLSIIPDGVAMEVSTLAQTRSFCLPSNYLNNRLTLTVSKLAPFVKCP
jgi:hypothetical protein